MSGEGEKNPRGIPKAPFIVDLNLFMKNDTAPDTVLDRFTTTFQQYKMMEASLAQKKRILLGKVPEMQSSLQVVKHLKDSASEESVKTLYELSDNLYATALIKPTTKVNLWLGANVMLEYDIEEAYKLLTDNLQTTETNLQQLTDDLGYLKEQITTMEVNIARIHNWQVAQRKKAAAQ